MSRAGPRTLAAASASSGSNSTHPGVRVQTVGHLARPVAGGAVPQDAVEHVGRRGRAGQEREEAGDAHEAGHAPHLVPGNLNKHDAALPPI